VPRRPTLTELQGKRVRWLLTVEAIGRAWRWSSSPCEVTDATRGDTYVFYGGLPEVEVRVLCSPATSVSEPQPITIEVAWPDIVTHLQRGHRIRGTAELVWWPEGVDWASRYIVLTGDIEASSHDSSSDPVSITITPAVAEERAEVPHPSHTISEEAFGAAGGLEPSPHVMGRHYPLVFGSPGVVAVYDEGSALFGDGLFSYPGSPGLQSQSNVAHTSAGDDTYTANRVLLADGHVDADNVTVLHPGAGSGSWNGYKAAVTNTTDDLGRRYAYADVAGGIGSHAAVRTTDDLYISWQSDYTTPKRAMLGDDNQPIVGVGGVLDYMLRRSTVPYETAAWLGVRAYLDAWAVDVYIDEPVGPWTWCADALLPHIPVSVVVGPRGLAPVLWRPDAEREQAIDHLRVESNCARASSVRLMSDGESTASAMYALDADTGDSREEVTMAPETDIAAGIGSTIWTREARDAVGADGVGAADVHWTASKGTAYAAAAWRTALAAGWDEVSVDCDQDRGYLWLGDVVLLTDADVGFASRPAQVGGITLRDSGVITLHLVAWRSPALSFTGVPLNDVPRGGQQG